MKSKTSILLLTCGAMALSPLAAQDGAKPDITVKPAEPINPKERKDEPRREKERAEKKRPEHEERGKPEKDKPKQLDLKSKPAPHEKMTPYLGLLLRGVSPELAAQVGIPEGFGLVVADVAKGSPAFDAKFETHDVITMIGDQRVVNMPQFQALVRTQKKGEEVTLTLHRRGEEQKVTAKIGERMMPIEPPHGPMPHPMMQCPHAMRPMHHHPLMNEKRPPMEKGPHGNPPDMKPRGHSRPDERRDRGPEDSRNGDRRPGHDQPMPPSKTKA